MDGIQQIEQIEQLDIENVDPGVIENSCRSCLKRHFIWDFGSYLPFLRC